MRTFIFKAAIIAALCSFMIPPVQAEGENAGFEALQKEKKTEKEPFDWEKIRPKKLSGDPDIDNYILSCDTIWAQVLTYRESIVFYRLDTFYCPKENCMLVQLRDEEGNRKNIGKTFLQSARMTIAGLNLASNALRITSHGISATTALANKPLLLLTYGKCLKAAPVIVKIAVDEGKAIAAAKKEQTRQLKELYEGRQEGSTAETFREPYEGEIPPNAVIIEDTANFDLGASEEEEISPEELRKLEEEAGLI